MKAIAIAQSEKVRTGLIARKIGMSAYFDENGNRVAVTVLEVKDNFVTQVKNLEKEGYLALQIGTKINKASRLGKPQKSDLEKKKLPMLSLRREFVVSPDCAVNVGEQISVEHFTVGQFVDVQGVSVGKGFAGVMKRHNFRGLEATHGVSIAHRSHGSTGQCQDPGRVFKGKKMAGHMGDVTVTVQNLKVVLIDAERSLIFVKGAVPGAKNSFLLISDAVKKKPRVKLVYPAKLVSAKSADEQTSAVASENATPEAAAPSVDSGADTASE